MRRTSQKVISQFIGVLLSICVLTQSGTLVASEPESIIHWGELAPIPNKVGLAGMFAGIHENQLIAAGGANFPDAPPWQGGTKIWHDEIFLFDFEQSSWNISETRLPRPLAYGVSVTHSSGVIFVGGDDGETASREVYRLSIEADGLKIQTLPELPRPCTQMCGALIGDQLYIAGGIDSLDATSALNTFWSLDLSDPQGWKELATLSSGRMQSVAGVLNDKLYLFGGIELRASAEGQAERIAPYLTETWVYQPSADSVGSWQRLNDMPHPVAAAPSPAFTASQTHLILLGGVDGSLLDVDPAQHPGFPSRILAYNPITDRWSQPGTFPSADSRVTAPFVSDGNRGIIVSGESRPGIRSPRVMEISFQKSARQFGWINWSVLVAYLAGLVGIGFFFASREKSTDDFFLAGRRIPWWAAGLSIFATMLSAITYLALPARSYGTNWTYFVFNWGILAIAPIIVYIYLPFFRRLNVTTAYEYLERRFSLGIRLLGSLSFIVFQFGRMGVVVLLPALALSAATGMNVYLCILVMGILSTLYTVLGGIEAVIWTDVLQTIVLLGGAIAAVIVVASQIDGGFVTILQDAQASHKMQLVNLRWDWMSDGLAVIILAGVFNNLVSYSTDQAVIQRYLTTKNEAEAGRAIWTNALLSIPASALFFFVGTALFVFYQRYPAQLEPLEKTDQIFAWFIVQEMPPGISGLVIAGVFAAAMSSLDSSIHSVSTAITTDFVRRFRPAGDETSFLNVARGLTLLLGAIGTIAAALMASQDIEYLFTYFLGIVGLFGGTLCGLFMLGIFTERVTAVHAWAGIAVSYATLIVASYVYSVNGLLLAALGAIVCFVISYLAALVIPEPTGDLTGLTLARLERDKTATDD